MGVVVPHHHQREERHNGREYFVQLELFPNYGDNGAREFVSDDNRISTSSINYHSASGTCRILEVPRRAIGLHRRRRSYQVQR